MKQTRYSRKIKQFRNTARQINELIEADRWHSLSAPPQRKLQWKLNNLFATIRNLLSRKELKKILAAAAFLICIGTVNAQTFAPAVTNPYGLTNAGYLNLPFLADIDGDGDLDIITLSYYGQIKFYQNTGTPSSPAFTTPQTNPFLITYPANGYRPVLADLDDDGDLDILAGEYYGAFKYLQNLGTATSPSFGTAVLNPFGLDSALKYTFPALGDFDNDGDLDIIANEYYGVIRYYQNNGNASSPNFATPTTNPYGIYPGVTYGAFPAVCDLDNDGDLDLLAGEIGDHGDFLYYQNTGSSSTPNFAYPLSNPFGLTAVGGYSCPTFGDLDNDGDEDLLVGDSTGNFFYFRNTTIDGINEFGNEVSFSVSPNPASDHILINAGENNYTITILDATGKLIYKDISVNANTDVNTAGFSKGVYIVELSDGNKASRKKLIIE